jgi:hypothetical protein
MYHIMTLFLYGPSKCCDSGREEHGVYSTCTLLCKNCFGLRLTDG